MAEVTLYLFDGSNLFHAGAFTRREELIDQLASFISVNGVRGVVVFDGMGAAGTVGALEVRFAAHADTVLERLAAEHRDHDTVLVVTSDAAIRETSGLAVQKRGSLAFLEELGNVAHRERSSSRVGDRIDEATRARLEQLRRGRG